MVNPENVNEVIAESGLSGEIDLLSIDMDSCNYWLREAIQAVRARVVVVEANAIFGDRSPVVPDYAGSTRQTHNEYYGASLAALASLGRRLGYRLVAVNRLGFNAFFVERDLKAPSLPELPLANTHSFAREAKKQFPEIAQYPLHEIPA